MCVHQHNICALSENFGGKLGPHATENIGAGRPVAAHNPLEAELTGRIHNDDQIEEGIQPAFEDKGRLHDKIGAAFPQGESPDLLAEGSQDGWMDNGI